MNLFDKTAKVIESCVTPDHLDGAYNYLSLAQKQLMIVESQDLWYAFRQKEAQIRYNQLVLGTVG